MRTGLWAICLLLGCTTYALSQEGYRVTRTRAVVDRAADWQAWHAAIGSAVIEADDTVRPRYLRRDINAMLNAGEFKTPLSDQDTLIGGIRSAGSRLEEASRIMDGDASTCWEPDLADGLDNWVVDVELGRSVVAERVVVRFADEGMGDPFLKFRVLLSNGRERTRLSGKAGLEFYLAGQVTRPNKEQREFRFEVRPQRPLPEGVTGEVAQVVRFEALDTDSTRGFEVDGEAYPDLAPEDRGTVEYFRQTLIGRQILVDQETYAALPAEEKGPVRYFRRERPCLAELEVYTPGDNIVNLTQRLRNRDVDLFENVLRALSTDGFFRSFYTLRVYDPVQDKNQLKIDLGAKFWLDRIRLLTAAGPIAAYQVRVSDGALDPGGHLIWEAFDERLNRELFLQLEEQFPRREVRYLELRRLELVGGRGETGNLSEIQAYGEGYVSEVTLTSPIIRLGGSRMFTAVTWEGEAPPDTRLEIRTRSGDDLTRVAQYFDVWGRQVSQEQWEAMNVRNRGEVIIEELPGPGWSNWSAVYRESGEGFQSPSPRQMAQVQVRLLTRDPLRAARLRRLQLGLAPPLVDQTFAEVWPVDGVEPGVDQEFALYLRPQFAAGDAGFDRVRLHSSSSAPIEMLSFTAGREGELRFGRGDVLWPGEVRVEEMEDGGVELILPGPVTGGEQIYAARFRTRVYLSGTTFSAALTRASRPGVIQAVSEGDASTLVGSQSLLVVADVEHFPLLHRVRCVPRIFTPNGDGVNDGTEIRFSIYRLVGERQIWVAVFDLSGRRVRELSVRREHPSGNHAIVWDGCDESGHRVPPGIYVVRVGFSTDAEGGETEAVSAVFLAY